MATHKWPANQATRPTGSTVPPRRPSTSTARRQPLREQLARAARLQRSLLPDVNVPIGDFRLASLYWPCEMLGGDFYDVARQGRSAVLLAADVMGHGVEAALVTMLVKAAFQDSAQHADHPVALLAGMRERLHRTLRSQNAFVATLLVRLDVGDPCVQVVNAGLPHPFVLRATERRLDEVPLDGSPVGLADDPRLSSYTAGRVSLDCGDVLLIASDGLGSIEGPEGDYFEDGRLRRTLEGLTGRSGREVIEALAAEARAFSRGPLPDDVNLVTVWRPAPPASGSSEPWPAGRGERGTACERALPSHGCGFRKF